MILSGFPSNNVYRIISFTFPEGKKMENEFFYELHYVNFGLLK
jgi:hypothetical protein